MRLAGSVTIPKRPGTVGGMIGWARGVNRALQELRDRKIVGYKKPGKSGNAKPPLWISLIGTSGGTAFEVWAKFGHVVPRHNASGDTGAPIAITSLPLQSSPVAAALNDKFWVKLTIDVYGKCTAAAWETGATWPTDSPPSLIGGDDQTGTAGIRYVRIGEIIEDPDSTSTPKRIICKQLHTGHIDYCQPELLENYGAPLTGGEAGVLWGWNADGRWDLRSIVVEGALSVSIVGGNIIITDCCS